MPPHPPRFALALLVAFAASCSRQPAATAAKDNAAPSAASAAPAATPPAASAPQTASFKFPTQTLTVPAGFTVELVAGPPLVDRPISIAFDEQGRLYATDSSGLSDRAPVQFEQKPHRIVRLEDADGDGKFEKSTVFAENMMFPQGALFYEGSLYVGAPPHIWKLTDKNGDGVSDEREAWHDGKTLTGCANDLHGPYLGPDGWFYWTKGASAEQSHEIVGGKTFVSRAAHIWRGTPDGKLKEPVMTGGMDNPVGVTFTASGERILSGTFFQIGTPGKRDGLIHAIYGGVYGKDQPSIVGHTRTGDLMPIMTHMGAAAPCGSLTYRSRVFGDDYAGNLFVCYFNLRKISRHQLVPDGATFRTVDTDFVTSDSADFRPTDVLEDADGSLLIVDTGGWYKICCPSSQLAKPDVLGAIYRIRRTGAPKIDDPRGLKIPSTLPPRELAKLLDDPRPYVQERAVHLLGQHGSAAVIALSEVLHESTKSSTARRNAVWALARTHSPSTRVMIIQALTDKDDSVAHAAIHVASLARDKEMTLTLVNLVRGDNRALARAAAEALGRIGDWRAVEPLLAAAAKIPRAKVTVTGAPENPADRILDHSIAYALFQIGQLGEFEKLARDAEPGALRAAMVALSQIPNSGLKPEHVIGWLDSNVPVLKQTAGWVVGQKPEWGDPLAAFFRERLPKKVGSEAGRAELQTQLAQLAKSAGIQTLLAETAIDASAGAEARLLALRTMNAAGLRETPARWLTGLAQLLSRDGNDPALVRQAVATARALPQPRNGHPALAASLARTGRDTALPADVRLDALAATTPAALATVEPPLFEFVCRHLDAKEPVLVRAAAATTLAKASLGPEQQLALADTLKTVGPLETPRLLPAFEKKPNDALGLKVVASLRQSPGLAGLRANALRPLFAKYSPAVQQRADELITLVNADAARQNARVDELLAAVKDGDIRRGQAVFNSQKAACALCHTVGSLGGRLGPDLTGIGKIRDERELLEAIAFPSATFVRGYEPFTVATKAGAEHAGIIKKDTAEEVVLATGPDSEQRVPRGEIKSIEPGTVSPMPPGMDVVLTKRELADLVAFLKSRQ